MLRAISDNGEPQMAVLLTGDGAGYDDGVGFHADMERMYAAGWGIEVLSWERSCRRTLRDWASANGAFVKLDDHYNSITFLEGTRRPTALNLTNRPKASVRQSPAQAAEARAKAAAAEEIHELQREVETLKARKAAKDAKKEKFLRQQARRAAKPKK
jgi:hypothetical protein